MTGIQTVVPIGRIKKAIEHAARSHDVEAVRSLLTALAPYRMTEDLLRQTGLVYLLYWFCSIIAHVVCCI